MRYVVRLAKPLYVETPLWGDNEPMRPSLHVDGEKQVDTGLVDRHGNAICRRVQAPVGFGR